MTPASPVIVALGSNLGHSIALIHQALENLAAFADGGWRVSSLWRSAPLNCPPASPDFINAVALFEPRRSETPEGLLEKLQAIERRFGRVPKRVVNEPRPLDLDLIAFGDEVRSTSHLTIPHPRAHQRRFVLEPLAEIAPDLVLTGWPGTVRQCLAGLRTHEAVTRLTEIPGPWPPGGVSAE